MAALLFMCLSSPRALDQNVMKPRHFSKQAEIFRIGPEKSAEQHTKSPRESHWRFPRNPRWCPKWLSLNKNISCTLEIAHNKLKFSV